jgi:phosphatidate cytidylyltransferase
MLGTWEFARLQNGDLGARRTGNFLLLVSALYATAAAWFGFHSRGMISNASAHAIPFGLDAFAVLVMLQGSFVLSLRGPLEGERTLRRVMAAVLGFVYAALPVGFLLRILFFNENGAHLLLLVILIVKFGDMGAYALGTWLGRHKMIPHISPAKSWEGLGGAFAGSMVAMTAMKLLDTGKLALFTWPQAFGFAALLCAVGVIGDLAESVLKRCHGVKDSGHTLPGIGGILDLTDSLLFAAPVAYFYLKAVS